jgi:hypothetical protein
LLPFTHIHLKDHSYSPPVKVLKTAKPKDRIVSRNRCSRFISSPEDVLSRAPRRVPPIEAMAAQLVSCV